MGLQDPLPLFTADDIKPMTKEQLQERDLKRKHESDILKNRLSMNSIGSMTNLQSNNLIPSSPLILTGMNPNINSCVLNNTCNTTIVSNNNIIGNCNTTQQLLSNSCNALPQNLSVLNTNTNSIINNVRNSMNIEQQNNNTNILQQQQQQNTSNILGESSSGIIQDCNNKQSTTILEPSPNMNKISMISNSGSSLESTLYNQKNAKTEKLLLFEKNQKKIASAYYPGGLYGGSGLYGAGNTYYPGTTTTMPTSDGINILKVL